MNTFWRRPVNTRFSAYRKQLAFKHTKYLVVKTDDATESISEIRYDFKKTIVAKLKDENYERINKDIYIGAKDFIVIHKEWWG